MDERNEQYILRIAESALSIDGHALADVLEKEMIPASRKPKTKKSLQAQADVLRAMGTASVLSIGQ